MILTTCYWRTIKSGVDGHVTPDKPSSLFFFFIFFYATQVGFCGTCTRFGYKIRKCVNHRASRGWKVWNSFMQHKGKWIQQRQALVGEKKALNKGINFGHILETWTDTKCRIRTITCKMSDMPSWNPREEKVSQLGRWAYFPLEALVHGQSEPSITGFFFKDGKEMCCFSHCHLLVHDLLHW